MKEKALPTDKYEILLQGYNDRGFFIDKLRSDMIDALMNPTQWKEILKASLAASTSFLSNEQVDDIAAEQRVLKNKRDYDRQRQRVIRGHFPTPKLDPAPLTDEQIAELTAPPTEEELEFFARIKNSTT